MASKKTKRENANKKKTNIIPVSYDQEKPVWIFTGIDRSGEFAFTAQRFKKDSHEILDKIINYSTMTWNDIKRQKHDDNRSKHHLLSYDSLSEAAKKRLLAKHLEDKSDEIFSFAFNNLLRIIGFRDKEKFYVLWYDPNHDVCPSTKKCT